MFASASFIAPYCCIGLQQFQSGVSIVVDYFCLLIISYLE
jgi:hypothetical protein